MANIQDVERYVLQVALSRGWIEQAMLERAAKFRQKQTEQGRKTTLLRVLRPFVSPENYRNLELTWTHAAGYGAGATPPAQGSPPQHKPKA